LSCELAHLVRCKSSSPLREKRTSLIMPKIYSSLNLPFLMFVISTAEVSNLKM